ncbi:MAG: hypothetical protein ACOCVC_02515 [Spirochaeta sp.]
MKLKPHTAVLSVIVLLAVGVGVFLLLQHFSRIQIEESFAEAISRADTALQMQDRIRAEKAIREAMHIADSEFTFTRVMRRAHQYYLQWDGPDLLYQAAESAVKLQPQEQRFWALAVDAALAAEEYEIAKNWAFENLRHQAFQDIVLEAVLRGGGITTSDGSEFGDLLLLLSRLLEEPTPEGFRNAAHLTDDPRYAVNSVLLYLNQAEHQAAYTILQDFPSIQEVSPALVSLLYAELGYAETALQVIQAHPPAPEIYVQAGIDILEADLLLRTGNFDAAIERYLEIINTADECAPTIRRNFLYALTQANKPFSQQGQFMLDWIQSYPNCETAAITLLQWYDQPEEAISPFAPELHQLHLELQTELALIHNNPDYDIELYNLVSQKREIGPESYRAQLWLLMEEDPDNIVLQKLIFFHALSTGDLRGIESILRRSEHLNDDYPVYQNIINRQWEIPPDEIHPASADVSLLLNIGLLALYNSRIDEAAEHFSTAAQRAYGAASRTQRDEIRSYAYTGMGIAHALRSEYDRGYAALQHALEIQPGNSIAGQADYYIKEQIE